MSLKEYDAKQITVFICGILIDSGLDEETFLTIEQDEADYGKVTGADGQATRYRTNNRGAKIVLSVMQTSDSNGFLGALSNAGLLAANGSDVGPLMVRDRVSGVCMYTAAECWISKPPNVEYAKKPTPRKWDIDVATLVRVDAGS